MLCYMAFLSLRLLNGVSMYVRMYVYTQSIHTHMNYSKFQIPMVLETLI